MKGRFVKLLAGAALSSVAMFGSTAFVDLTTVTSNQYPFIGTVSGTPNVELFCDDSALGDYVQQGEEWTATETSLQQIKTNGTSGLLYASAGTSLYEAVGWLAWEYVNNLLT